MLVFLPALYGHGVYALAAHFLPRYAVPQILLRVTATVLLLYLAWTLLRTVWARRAARGGPCSQPFERVPVDHAGAD